MQMLFRACLVCLIFFLTSVSANAGDYTVEYGKVGKWTVFGAKEKINACVVDTDNANVTLRIVYHEEVGAWGVAQPYYGEHTKNGYAVQINGQMALNDGPEWGIEFSADGDGWASYFTQDDQAFEKQLRSGSKLELNMDRGWQAFSLKNSSAALDMVIDCANNNGRRPAKRVAQYKPQVQTAINTQGFSDIVNVPNSTEHKYASVRGWDVYGGNVGGQFEYCVAEKNDGGSVLRFGVDKNFGQWQLAVPYPARREWEGQLEIDGNAQFTQGTSDGQWSIAWLNNAYDLERIRNGNVLILDIGKASIDHTLRGSAAVILKIEECVNNRGKRPRVVAKRISKPRNNYQVESDAHRMGTGCPRLGTVFSPNSNTPATIEFIDQASQADGAKQVYWIDGQGNPVSISIFDNRRANISSYTGHKFVVKNFDGRCFGGVYEVRAGHNRFFIR